MRPRRLKLGTHVDSGQLYRVYRNQAAAAYSSLYSFFFHSNFQTLKFFVTLFSGTVRPTCRRLKLGTHVDSGWIYRVYRNQASAAYSPLFFSLAHLSRRLIRWAYRMGLEPASVRPCVHTFKHEYRWDQQADYNQILSEASLGWGKGCIRFWCRSDQNSVFHGNG